MKQSIQQMVNEVEARDARLAQQRTYQLTARELAAQAGRNANAAADYLLVHYHDEVKDEDVTL